MERLTYNQWKVLRKVDKQNLQGKTYSPINGNERRTLNSLLKLGFVKNRTTEDGSPYPEQFMATDKGVKSANLQTR